MNSDRTIGDWVMPGEGKSSAIKTTWPAATRDRTTGLTLLRKVAERSRIRDRGRQTPSTPESRCYLPIGGLDRHEHIVARPVDQEKGWTIGGALERRPQVVDGPHRLTVDFLNHI